MDNSIAAVVSGLATAVPVLVLWRLALPYLQPEREEQVMAHKEESKPLASLVDAKFIGTMLKLHEGTVRRLARDGVIPCVRINHKVVRFDPEAVMAALRSRAAKARG